MAQVKVESYDNRGTPTEPFGFVYFSDGTRVGYTPKLERGKELWAGNWGPVDHRHMRAAYRFLTEKGVEFEHVEL